MISRILLLAAVLFVTGAAIKPSGPKPLPPAEAVKQGRELVAQLLSEKPAQDTTNTGVLNIRPAHGTATNIFIRFEARTGGDQWETIYTASRTPGATPFVRLRVAHKTGAPNEYFLSENKNGSIQNGNSTEKNLTGNEAQLSFAGSDFAISDLGLEFLHWPDQRVLRKEIRRGQSCDVLQSINPKPAPGAYSRVISWIDIDSGGIMNAEAYDSNAKLWKEFIAKSVKKIRGQWELEEIEMDNHRTDSRTTIKFDLSSK